MPSDFPGSPKLLKGALVVYESHTPGSAAKVIAFQYNPEQVSRTLKKRDLEKKQGSRGAAQEDVLRAQGPPEETVKLSIVLNAADQLEEPEQNENVVTHGLHPVLATLEMLLYPTNAQVLQNEALADGGEVQLNPADLPLTLLVWGKSRVVPVLLNSFSVTEEAFDQALNPIQAKVEIELQVLTYIELKPTSQGRDVYLSYQTIKEKLASKHQAGTQVQQIKGLLPN